MPRNASGVYSTPSGTLAVTATTIASTPYNNFVNDIASAMTGSLPRDGSAGMQAPLPMGGNKISGLGAATAAGDALRFEQFFPSGTLMLFQQTSAPTGWTKQTTHNDKVLRVVSGTPSFGGLTDFSSVFAARTIAIGNLPIVNLSLAALTGSVGTTITNGSSVTRSLNVSGGTTRASGGSGDFLQGADINFSSATLSLASGAVAFGGTVPLGGSGTAMDFAVKYVDLIICARD